MFCISNFSAPNVHHNSLFYIETVLDYAGNEVSKKKNDRTRVVVG